MLYLDIGYTQTEIRHELSRKGKKISAFKSSKMNT